MKTKKQKIVKNKTAKKIHTVSSPCFKVYKPFIQDLTKHTSKDIFSKNHKQLMKLFVSKLRTRYAPSKITAQSDYYTYINYRWIKNQEPDSTMQKKTQEYITEYDDFRIVQDRVYWQLNRILKDYIKENSSKKATAVKNFYSSATNLNDIRISKACLKEYISKLDELRKDKNNIWKLLGMLNKNEMIKSQLPFSWSMSSDEKKSTINKLHINPMQLPILDLKAYYEKNNMYRKKFIDMCKKMFKICLEKEDYKYYMDAYNVCVKIFITFGCKGPKEDKSGYNLVTKSDALTLYGFDLEAFAKELGYKTTPDSFITSQLNYLKCCSELLMKEWNSEEWRGYWIMLYLRQLSRCTKQWIKLFDDYYGIIQEGEESMAIAQIRAVIYSTLPFNNLLTTEYIKKYEDETKVEYVKGMTHDLKNVFTRIISRNTWLSPKTKKSALNKLSNLEFQISRPFYLEDDPEIDYSPTDFWHNMEKLFESRTQKFIKMDEAPLTDLPMIDFNKSPPKIVGFQ